MGRSRSSSFTSCTLYYHDARPSLIPFESLRSAFLCSWEDKAVIDGRPPLCFPTSTPTLARYWSFLVLIFLSLLSLLLNKLCASFVRSHDLLTIGVKADRSDHRRGYQEMASRALQFTVVPPIKSHTATVVILHVSTCINPPVWRAPKAAS